MSLSDRDVCTQRITPALVAAGWDVQTQIREEVGFTTGRIIVRGRLVDGDSRSIGRKPGQDERGPSNLIGRPDPRNARTSAIEQLVNSGAGPRFGRYVGVDYSGAQTAESSLRGLRVYLARAESTPVEVAPPPSPRRYWTRRDRLARMTQYLE